MIERAKEVIHLHNSLMHLSRLRLIAAINAGLIVNTPLTATIDVRNSEKLYGKYVHCIAGKTTVPHYSSSLTIIPAQNVGQIIVICTDSSKQQKLEIDTTYFPEMSFQAI
jgi:hypothetical protein